MTEQSQAQPLFGLPSASDLIAKIPGASELKSLKTDVDDFAGTIDKLTTYVNQYSWVPGASAVVGPLQGLNKGLQFVKKLIDFIPS